MFIPVGQKQISPLPYVPTLRGVALLRTRMTKYNNIPNTFETKICGEPSNAAQPHGISRILRSSQSLDAYRIINKRVIQIWDCGHGIRFCGLFTLDHPGIERS